MDAAEILDGLVELGKDDWIALWMIVEDVEAELEPDSDARTLELTITLVEGLLKRGFLAMPRLDLLKEEIGYFKFWLGIVTLTDISVMGWVISAMDSAAKARLMLAALAVLVLSWCAAALHRSIDRRMQGIREL